MAMMSPRPLDTMVGGMRDGGAGGPDGLLLTRVLPTTANATTRTFAMSATEMAVAAPAGRAAAGTRTRNDRTGMVARLADSLEEWRNRIDLLLRRSDLEEADLLGDRLAHLQVSWEVAHQRLWVSATTVGQDADTIYHDVEDALADVKVAYAEVAAVLARR